MAVYVFMFFINNQTEGLEEVLQGFYKRFRALSPQRYDAGGGASMVFTPLSAHCI
jgi:hypothetical protein